MIKYITAVLMMAFHLPTFADGFKVVILGTGTPMSYPNRSGPGVAIISGGEAYIVDSGAGIFRKARAAVEQGINELAPPNLDKIFLTHLHSDHTAGLSNMILAPWVLRRTVPLKLYGPPGSKHMADNLLEAYSQDIDMRLHGSQPANPEGYKVITQEHEAPGQIFEDENIIVEAIKVPHGSWEHAYGYKFTEKASGKTALISGDTAKSEAIMEAAIGVDILVHEIGSEISLSKRPAEWQTYHRSYHTMPDELVEIANKAKPRLLKK